MRSLNLQPGVDVPHVRWVSVTKDGEWLRNDNNTFHATWEEAEEAVERRIRSSIARYERLARQRSAAANFTATFDSPLAGQIVINTTTAARPHRLRSNQGCLLVIAIALGTLIAAVQCIANGL